MFRSATNSYDEVIAKATDEKQTVENWDILLTVWDKVNEDGEVGARNCVAALQKRLQHRSANVQLFSLTVADALVNNCGPPLHKEISGRAFTQTLVRLVNDRTTHDDVKKRVLKLIDGWVKEHRKNPDFDLMVETHESLKAQNHKFTSQESTSPVRPSDEALRREEEELQRALAESAALSDPSRAGFKQSSPSDNYTSRKSLPRQPSPELYSSTSNNRRNSSPSRNQSRKQSLGPVEDGSSLRDSNSKPPSRVRALYDFDTQTSEELPFRKGDIIKVIECVYSTWWRGELRGMSGIFPTVYVEEIVDPSPADLAQEAEMESALFAQSASIDKLLHMMRTIDTQSENVAENEELLELYQQSMALRPKVVKLIEKYNQKQAELSAINEKFTKAKSTYDHLIESSTQRYSAPPPNQPSYVNGGYSNNYTGYERNGATPYQQQQPQYPQHQPQQIPPQHQLQQQPLPPQHQLQQSQPQPQPQQPQHQQQPLDPTAGWTEQQRRDYDQQWAEYQRASQEYAQYYISQGLPIPHQDEVQQAPQQYHPVESPQSSQPLPSPHPSQPQPQHVQSLPPQIEQAPVVDPLQPYWDGKNWIYHQPPPLAPSQNEVVQQQQQPQHHHQQQSLPPASNVIQQHQPQSIQSNEPTWNGYEWIYPQVISPTEQSPAALNTVQAVIPSPQYPIQSPQPLNTSTEISSQAYGASPYPLADQFSSLSIEIPQTHSLPSIPPSVQSILSPSSIQQQQQQPVQYPASSGLPLSVPGSN